MNLTAIKDPALIAKLHFVDSLAGLRAHPQLPVATSAVDIGSGAGFPLLPLALLAPGVSWTALESVAKKARFIEETARELDMTNVHAAPMRAEDAARGDMRESVDVVSARAVGPVAALCEVGLPLLKPGGLLMLYKTESSVAEAEALSNTLAILGGTQESPYHYRLEGDQQDRVILRIRKTGTCSDKYPRRGGVPFNKPLVG